MYQETQFRKFLDFSEEESCREDEKRWVDAFLYLMKKLSYRNKLMSSPNDALKRLLIKSPIHTARVPLLRRLFPKAKFVYIHRDPFEVFQSAAHMADTAYWYCYLNTPSDEQVVEFILWQFEHMWLKYTEAAHKGHWLRREDKGRKSFTVSSDIIEISYRELTGHETIRTLQRVYEHIGLPWTSHVESHYRGQVKDLCEYRPNSHSSLSEPLKRMIAARWADFFETYSYPYQSS